MLLCVLGAGRPELADMWRLCGVLCWGVLPQHELLPCSCPSLLQLFCSRAPTTPPAPPGTNAPPLPLPCLPRPAGSQVCNLSWSKNVNELVSTHGYSQNQIIVWRYPAMQKMATLTGHTMRVLYLAVSPDGQTIVTGEEGGRAAGAHAVGVGGWEGASVARTGRRRWLEQGISCARIGGCSAEPRERHAFTDAVPPPAVLRAQARAMRRCASGTCFQGPRRRAVAAPTAAWAPSCERSSAERALLCYSMLRPLTSLPVCCCAAGDSVLLGAPGCCSGAAERGREGP